MEKELKHLVGVRCFTFNQSKYILDALNGFVMQQTNFPFVVMIVDDASTDGEQEVIANFISEQFDTNNTSIAYEKETDYARIAFAQHKTNKNCYFAILYLKENHHSQRKPKIPYLSEWRDCIKYEALCEGDDYWIHPQKLQMQVDFMEDNMDYSLCFHGANIKLEAGIDPNRDGRVGLYKNLEKREYSGAEILRNWTIPTASVLFRKETNRIMDNRFIYGDTPLFLSCAEHGKLFCICKEPMSVYRLSPDSAVSVKRHWKKYIDYYKAIEERYSDFAVKKEAKKLVLIHYVTSFIGGHLKKQSMEVIRDVVVNDKEYAIRFFVLLPIIVTKIFINKNIKSLCYKAY